MNMIMVYLIVKGLEGISFDGLFTYCDLPTRYNGYKLYKNHCHLNFRKKFLSKEYQRLEQFTPRNYWIPNVIIFKTKLDVYWQDLCYRFLDS